MFPTVINQSEYPAGAHAAKIRGHVTQLSDSTSLDFGSLDSARKESFFYRIYIDLLTNFLITSVCPACAAVCNGVALSLSSRLTEIPASFNRI